jgi:hypothetical protein
MPLHVAKFNNKREQKIPNRNLPISKWFAILFAASISIRSGCGGGSSSESGSTTTGTLSGVTAVGTPIVGGNINVICESGSPLSTTTSSTGTGGTWSYVMVVFSIINKKCAKKS